MFTANTTPKMKLMKPLDSDQFESSDFSDSMTILDNNPGIAMVDAYTDLAKLTAGVGLPNYLGAAWTTAQNGRLAYDRHNDALWRYNNPSGTATWVRVNSKGLLKSVSQSTDVATKTSTGTTGALVMTTGAITVPGGRALQININLGADNTSGSNGLGVFTLTDGSTILRTVVITLGVPHGTTGNWVSFQHHLYAPSPESSHTYNLYVRSAPYSASYGGGGTTTVRSSTMNILEL